MTFVRHDRPVLAAFVVLGRIYDLNVRVHLDNPDVELVAWSIRVRSARSSARPTGSRSTPWRRRELTTCHHQRAIETTLRSDVGSKWARALPWSGLDKSHLAGRDGFEG